MGKANNFKPIRKKGEWMIRGLYFSGQEPQRLLTVDEIATACRISPKRVKGLLAMKILLPVATDDDRVNVGQLLWFLLRNNMPVASSLLPPKTGRILFLAASVSELHEKEQTFDHICRLFAHNRNLVLAESTTLGRQAHLTLLTFAPDVVVVFQRSFSRDVAAICEILSAMPSLKTILVVDRATQLAVDNGLLAIAADLVIAESLPLDQLSGRLDSFFSG